MDQIVPGGPARAAAPRTAPDPPPAPLIERARLTALEFGPADRLMLVRAPAGYGKTTLLGELWRRQAQRRGVVIWLDLAELDVDAEEAAELVRRRLAGQGDEEAFVFIDRLESLAGGGATEPLQRLFETAPSQVHFILAGRERIGLRLGKLRAAGQLRELGPAELRMDEGEALALLERQGLRDPETCAEVLARCEGWAAGLALSGRALASLSGAARPFAEFFAEEAFDAQDEAVRLFLMRTSILDRVSADLGRAVSLAPDSRALLELCERRGLFLFSLDEEQRWFRFHPLFAEFVRRRLEDTLGEEIPALHRRASDWLVGAGLYVEAFDHAVRGGDHARAAEILDAHCTDSYGENLDQALLGLIGRLSPDVRRKHPRITLAAIWPLLFAWRFDQAEKLLRTCRRQLDEIRSSGGIAEEELAELEHLFLHREMMLSLYQDDMQLVQGRGEKLMREYDGARPLVKASIYVSLIQAHCEEYRLREVERLELSARQYLSETGHPLAMIPIESVVARARLLSGQARLATEPLVREVERADHHPEGEMLGSLAALTLAEILYEQNRLEEASALLERRLRATPEFGFVDCWIGGQVTRSRLLQVAGEPERAEAQLARAAAGASGTGGGPERIQVFLGCERLRLLLRTGQGARAVALARELGLDGRPILPIGRVSLRDEMRARGWTEHAMFAGRHAEALKLARQWRAFTAGAGAVRSAIHWDIVIASLLLREGDERAALRSLRQAIVAAAPGGCLRALLDEAPAIGRILLAQPQVAADAQGQPSAFGAELIAELGRTLGEAQGEGHLLSPKAEVPVSGALSPREVEMLKMVASGLRNREIADRLAMTESSVKWQLHQTYAKLGADRRIHAIARARQLGFVLPA